MEETVYSVVTPSKYLERQRKGEVQLREFTTVSTTLISTLLFLAPCLSFLFLSFVYLTVPFTFFVIPFPFIPSPFVIRSVQHAVSLLFASLCHFLITRLFLIFFSCSFSYFVCLLSILCFLCYCNVLPTVSPLVQFLYKFNDQCHRVETHLQ